MKTVVIGGGITGRIVQFFIPNAVVLESKTEEESNRHMTRDFGANYLWEPLGGFGCRPLKVVTTVDWERPNGEAIKRYKNKIGKGYENKEDYLEQFQYDSIGWQITDYPPCRIDYGMKVLAVDINQKVVTVLNPGAENHEELTFKLAYDVLFTSMPLPGFVKIANLQNVWPVETMFRYQPIYVRVSGDYQKSNLIVVNYISDPTDPRYRVTARDGQKHVESLSKSSEQDVKIFPGKIYEDPMVPPLLSFLRSNNIFPIGRFGKWESDELVHNTYAEIRDLTKGFKNG